MNWREATMYMAAHAVLGYANALTSLIDSRVLEALSEGQYRRIIHASRNANAALGTLEHALRNAAVKEGSE
jgi:hypothetical protein